MKTTISCHDSAEAMEWSAKTHQQLAHPTYPSEPLIRQLGTQALEEALVALAFDRSGLPDLDRANHCASAIIEMGGLLMASIMCLKGQGSLAESSEKIKAAWSDKMRNEFGDRMLEIAGQVDRRGPDKHNY